MIETSPKEILQKVWKYQDFLPPQEEIISSVLSSKDTLALLPTGGGKSLCYQLPSLMFEGITLVVSPLMALIKDQIKQLQQKGIKAIYLSSDQNFLGQIDVYDYVRDSGCKLLYVAPERLQNYLFQQSLKSLNISLIAVDEAHCISEWGNDFRPAYTHIKKFREMLGHVPMIALTASATPMIQKEIQEKLGLQSPQIFKISFQRPNLASAIIQTENKFQHIINLLHAQKGSSILYVRTRAESKHIAHQLQNHGIQAANFHAGLSEKEKNQKQKDWMHNQIRVLVATNAFGMGIDKADVRSIIHYNLPYSIENYYQEIGRAGRDGATAQTLLLYNEYDIDQTYRQFMNFHLSEKEYKTMGQKLCNRWNWTKNDLQEEGISFDMVQFCSDYKFMNTKVSTLLQYWHNAGIIYWNPEPKLSRIQFLFSPYHIDQVKGFEKTILESLSRNISGIFNEAIKFNEKYWAKSLHISENELHQYFLKWKQKEWITYENGNFQRIQILRPREDKIFYGPMLRSFQSHQKHKLTKLKNLFYFVRNDSECRMKLLMRYFGEKMVKNCKQCDICKAKTQSNSQSLGQQIYLYIADNQRTLPQILAEFHRYEPDSIINALQELLQEDKLSNSNYYTYQQKH